MKLSPRLPQMQQEVWYLLETLFTFSRLGMMETPGWWQVRVSSTRMLHLEKELSGQTMALVYRWWHHVRYELAPGYLWSDSLKGEWLVPVGLAHGLSVQWNGLAEDSGHCSASCSDILCRVSQTSGSGLKESGKVLKIGVKRPLILPKSFSYKSLFGRM